MKIDTEKIRSYARENMSAGRFEHTLGVESEAVSMALLLGFDESGVSDIRTAALLHDITKEWSGDKQLDYCRENNIPLPSSGTADPTIHARTGAYFAREIFPEAVDDNVFGAIYYHTTGKSDMTTAEKIICLADYIEPGRKYESCRSLGEKFRTGLTKQNIRARIDECLRESFDMTIISLIKKGSIIDNDTFNARNFLIGTDPVKQQSNSI